MSSASVQCQWKVPMWRGKTKLTCLYQTPAKLKSAQLVCIIRGLFICWNHIANNSLFLWMIHASGIDVSLTHWGRIILEDDFISFSGLTMMFFLHCTNRFSLCLFLFTEIHLALKFTRENQALTSVPQDIDVAVTHLCLKKNNIVRITNTSLSLYAELIVFDLTKNGLTHIDNGAFDYNAKLEELIVQGNNIRQLPQSFGAASGSLKQIMFGLLYTIPSPPNSTSLNWKTWHALKLAPRIIAVDLMLYCFRKTRNSYALMSGNCQTF